MQLRDAQDITKLVKTVVRIVGGQEFLPRVSEKVDVYTEVDSLDLESQASGKRVSRARWFEVEWSGGHTDASLGHAETRLPGGRAHGSILGLPKLGPAGELRSRLQRRLVRVQSGRAMLPVRCLSVNRMWPESQLSVTTPKELVIVSSSLLSRKRGNREV